MTIKSDIEAAKNKAYLALLERHKGIIYKVARAYGKDQERDDRVQDICLQLWRSFDTYKDAYAESTWVYRIALNTCISAYRKVKTQTKDSRSIEPILYPEQNTQDDQLDALYQMIQQLKELDRAILVLHLEGKTHKEIGTIMGYTETNVSTRLNRIKTYLKSIANKL